MQMMYALLCVPVLTIIFNYRFKQFVAYRKVPATTAGQPSLRQVLLVNETHVLSPCYTRT
jgi:hypothetical protein